MPTKKTAAPATLKKIVTKKVVAKKAATVKSVKKVVKKATKQTLVYADNASSFWLVDGQILNSLLALHDALGTMKKTVYTHHVTKDKNDFSDWVASVLGDVVCADSLRKIKTATAAKLVIAERLKFYVL